MSELSPNGAKRTEMPNNEMLRGEVMKHPLAALFGVGSEIQHCYPGGNATYIVFNAGLPRHLYGELDGQIKGHNSAALLEQGGFLEPSERGNAVLRLQMAGGEFCGNAARSAAALIAEDFLNRRRFAAIADYSLARQQDAAIHFPLEVSGTSKTLEVSCLQEGRNWRVKTEMPVLPSFENISRHLIEIGGNQLEVQAVRMDGITHMLISEASLPFVDDKARYESILHGLGSKLGLLGEPALGCIWYSEDSGQLRIKPVVWVKAIDSYFFESACGSGTMAAALVHAKEYRLNKSKVAVLQPSGCSITAEVESNTDQRIFTRGTIEGVVELRGELAAS